MFLISSNTVDIAACADEVFTPLLCPMAAVHRAVLYGAQKALERHSATTLAITALVHQRVGAGLHRRHAGYARPTRASSLSHR